ncbi:MAG: HupE/UreJ family protein [Woeseiaceae bacterium]|nr:HupE/UreJ family protein [Woeseiaceae bacterium]
MPTHLRLLLVALAVCAVAAPETAQAHARSESYSNWSIDGGRMLGTVTVSTGEAMVLMQSTTPQRLEALFAEHLSATVAVDADGRACSAGTPVALAAARGFVRIELGFDCGDSRPTGLEYRALFDALPAHVHYARLFEDGNLLAERVMTARATRWQRDESAPSYSFLAFFDLGVRHIMSGVDHIAFLLGMLLVAATFGRSLAAITGFTLGHSLSLGAAVLGYLQANGRLVESFIGFTVALVAVEYFMLRRRSALALAAASAGAAWLVGAIAVAADLLPVSQLGMYLGFGLFAACYLLASARLNADPGRSNPLVLFAVTTCFGLIHGFGFAGFLMDTGIEGDSLLLPLLGFNLGVEAGQLVLVVLAFVLAILLRRTPVAQLAPVAASALCGIGVYWFVGRSLDGLL